MLNVGQKVQIISGKHKGVRGKITSRLPFLSKRVINPNEDRQHYAVLTDNGNGTVFGALDVTLRALK